MRADSVLADFRSRFERPAEALASAPGRLVLLGEHVDYEGGLVLPFAIGQRTFVAAAPRSDGVLAVRAEAFREFHAAALDALDPAGGPTWFRYVGGMVAEWREQIGPIGGHDLLVVGDVPVGRGLSSSASLTLALLACLETLTGRHLGDLEAARLAQRVEHRHAGVLCGLMDQLAIRAARSGHATLIDCGTGRATSIPLPPGPSYVLFDTGVRRELAMTAYNRRVVECRTAAAQLSTSDPAPPLATVTSDRLTSGCDRLDPVSLRRARHVVSEIARVRTAIEALQHGDAWALGPLLDDCHRSLRDDFEVSCPEIETLISAAATAPGRVGSRLVGAGFGGCTLNLVDPARLGAFVEHVTVAYRQATGDTATVLIAESGDGPQRHIVR